MARARKAEFEVGARSRKLDAELRKVRKKLQRWGESTRRDLRRSFSGIRRNLSTVVGFGGVAVFGSMAKKTFEFEKSLTRLQIQSGKSRVFMDSLRKSIRQTSNETGIAADDLLAGASQYVALTGDIDGASEALGAFAKIASGSGSAMSDVAATAAAMRQNLKIEPKDFEKAFSVLLTQGKEGAVELNELAKLMPMLGAGFQQFGKLDVAGVADLGAALQVARQGFGSSAEAATGLNGMMTALVKNAGKFKKAGVRVLDVGPDGVKRMRNLDDIIDDISKSKLMKDPEKLVKAFGREEGARAFRVLAQNREEFIKLRDAGLESQSVQEDFLTFQESAAGRQARAWQRLQNTIAKVITPGRIEKFAKLMERLTDLVGWISDHATEIGVAFGAWKLGQGLAALVSLVGTLKGAGGLGGLLKTGGMSAIPVTIVAGAGAGAAVGTAIDKVTGLSKDFDPEKQKELVRGGKIDTSAPLSVQYAQAARIQHEQAYAARHGIVTRRTDLSRGGELTRGFILGGAGVALHSSRFQQPAEDADAATRIARQLEAKAQAHASTEKLQVEIRAIVDRHGLLNLETEQKRKARSKPR